MYNSDCLESMFSHFLVSGNLSPWQENVPDITHDISKFVQQQHLWTVTQIYKTSIISWVSGASWPNVKSRSETSLNTETFTAWLNLEKYKVTVSILH